MASSTSTSILDAIRSGDLDTLEQASNEQLLRVARSRKHWLVEEAVKCKQWAIMWWLLDKAEQLGVAELTRGWTRAHCAAAQGDLDLLRDLTREELSQETSDYMTALHTAALGGQVEAIEFLVRERGLDPLAATNIEWTPLHLASEAGHVGAIEKLVELGADMNAVSFLDGTALSVAASEQHAEAVRCLLRLGCSTLALDGCDSAMHDAAGGGSVETVDVLLGHGTFHVGAVGRFGMRPLHHAALCGDVVMVKHLLALGAQVDAMDDYGSTALHSVRRENSNKTESMTAEVLRVLLVAGADRSIKNQGGKTARDLAVESGYESLVELLDEYWPVPLSMTQVLLGLRGPTESPLTRFSSHALFEPRVLSLIKCLLTGEDKGAFSQLMEEAERS